MQVVAPEAPTTELKVPVGQAVQAVLLALPTVALNVPAGHGVPAAEPTGQ